MRAPLLLAPALALAAILAAPNAVALGIVSSPAGASAITEVHVAVASDGARTSEWASLHIQGNATTVAWIIPVRPGAMADLSSDAWLEALDDATAPRVESPDLAPPCGIPGGVDVIGESPHVATSVPSAVGVAPDRATVEGLLSGWGLELTSDVGAGVDAAVAGGEQLLVLRYDANGDFYTRALRVVEPGAPVVPMSLVHAGASSVLVTAYALGPTRATLGQSQVLGLDPAGVLWQNDGTSTYASMQDIALAAQPGAWLAESAAHAPLFAGAEVVGGFDVAPLFQTYFARAAAYGDATADPASCGASTQANAASTFPVAAACPRGGLAQVDVDAGCEETVAGSELPPDAFRCGGSSDDLAVALSGLAPGGAWVTRAVSVIPASGAGADVAVSSAPDVEIGPVTQAAGYASTCGGGVVEPPPSGGSGGGSGGGGSSGASGSGAVGPSVVVAPSDDSCGGDTSSDDEESDGSGCDGSSSSSSDGSDSGSSGDDCSAPSGGDGSSSNDCAATPEKPHRHSPLSRTALAFVFLALVARRRRRLDPGAATR